MNLTPIGYRLHIAIFGRMNVGKSSLINAITNQEIAVVSDIPGTTTDPVIKTMELLPLGPVAVIDTAGLNDESVLGEARQKKTYQVMHKTDFAIIVLDAHDGITNFEYELISILKNKEIPFICAVNKIDLYKLPEDKINEIRQKIQVPVICVSSKTREGIEALKKLIIENARFDKSHMNIINDFVNAGDLVVLVTHIDCAAPRGRLILPQQQTIRDIIDCQATAIVTQEKKLKQTLESLTVKPSIVITDSLVSDIAARDTPAEILMTSFSILIARQKGELPILLRGLRDIIRLKSGSTLLIAETCTHHRQPDDLAKVKIPQYITRTIGKDVNFEWFSGTHFPSDVGKYDGILHCGGCMINRQEMQYRINSAREHEIPFTNYGMFIAYAQGILKRMLKPFTELDELIPDFSNSRNGAISQPY